MNMIEGAGCHVVTHLGGSKLVHSRHRGAVFGKCPEKLPGQGVRPRGFSNCVELLRASEWEELRRCPESKGRGKRVM